MRSDVLFAITENIVFLVLFNKMTFSVQCKCNAKIIVAFSLRLCYCSKQGRGRLLVFYPEPLCLAWPLRNMVVSLAVSLRDTPCFRRRKLRITRARAVKSFVCTGSHSLRCSSFPQKVFWTFRGPRPPRFICHRQRRHASPPCYSPFGLIT